MRTQLRRRVTFANVTSLIALFVALGGTSYAALKITGKNVKNSSLTGVDIKNSSLTTSDVKNGSLLSKDFRAGQLPAGPQGPQGAQGPKGDTGPQGPSDAFSGFKDGPVALPNGLATIGSLSIPTAGKYVISAKTWLHDNVNVGVLVQCRLVAGGDFDESRTSLEGNTAGYVSGAVVALQVAHEFAAPGTADLQCNGFGVNTEASFLKITAIRVGNLTNSPLS